MGAGKPGRRPAPGAGRDVSCGDGGAARAGRGEAALGPAGGCRPAGRAGSRGLAWRRFGDELHVRPAGIPEGGIEFASARAGAADWRVWAEETLRSVMSRWGARAGVEVVWRTDRHYRVHEGRVFRGRTFEEAVRLLFSALGDVPDAPAGRIAADGFSIAMTHVRRAGVAER